MFEITVLTLDLYALSLCGLMNYELILNRQFSFPFMKTNMIWILNCCIFANMCSIIFTLISNPWKKKRKKCKPFFCSLILNSKSNITSVLDLAYLCIQFLYWFLFSFISINFCENVQRVYVILLQVLLSLIILYFDGCHNFEFGRKTYRFFFWVV